MITRLLDSLCRTDSLPIVGGSAGALVTPTVIALPTWEQMLTTIVLAALGAVVGYFIKLLLDRLMLKPKDKDKIEYR